MEKLNEIIAKIEKIDYALASKTQKRLDNLTKPQGSLGRLEELAKQIVEITGNETPPFKNKVIFTMAGDHGITEEGVSAYPKEVTPQMVYNFVRGGAGINVLARHTGTRVVVVDMGVACDLEPHQKLVIKKVGYGTKNMAKGPAMTREEATKSLEAGMDVVESINVERGISILGTGDMGIGNTTASSAISAESTSATVGSGPMTSAKSNSFLDSSSEMIRLVAPSTSNGRATTRCSIGRGIDSTTRCTAAST